MILIELVFTSGGGKDKTKFCVMKCCVFVTLWYFLTDGDSMASNKNFKNNVFVSSYPSEYQIESSSLFGFCHLPSTSTYLTRTNILYKLGLTGSNLF